MFLAWWPGQFTPYSGRGRSDGRGRLPRTVTSVDALPCWARALASRVTGTVHPGPSQSHCPLSDWLVDSKATRRRDSHGGMIFKFNG